MNLADLDDPRPYVPSGELRERVANRARRLHRRRTVSRVAATVAVLAVPAAGLAAMTRLAPTRVHVITPAEPSTPGTGPASSASGDGTASGAVPANAGTAAPVAPVDVLVVGVDHRADDPSVTGSRGDTILLARIDPEAGTRSIRSIPRDLYVTDPATGRQDRINALVGERRSLVQVVEGLTGEHVDHYVELDFAAFTALSDAVGGVDLAFAEPVRDLHTGFEAPAGCSHLDGPALLSYVRSRNLREKVQSEGNFTWHDDPTSDFGRMARQGDVARRLVTRVLDGDRLDLVDVVTRLLPKLVVDDTLDLAEARRVLGLARSLAAAPVGWSTVPAHPATVTIDGRQADVLVPDTAAGGEAVPGSGEAGAAVATSDLAGATLPVDDPTCGG